MAIPATVGGPGPIRSVNAPAIGAMTPSAIGTGSSKQAGLRRGLAQDALQIKRDEEQAAKEHRVGEQPGRETALNEGIRSRSRSMRGEAV